MRSTQLTWIGALALLSLVVAAAPTFAEDPADAKAQDDGVPLGDLAPAWQAKKFLNSDELTLAGLRGKFVFIEFFGTG